MDERQQKEQALRDAAGNGDTNRVKQLIEEGVNPDAHTDDLFTLQKTPLHLAAENGHYETVSALLAAGVEVDAWDRLEMTPLHLAAWNSHHKTVSALLAAGADVDAQDLQHRTPLHLAAEKGHHETVSALLAAGAYVNARNKWQKTPLHLAAEKGHHETVSALLAAGAEVKVWDGQQRTPLHWAAGNGHHETLSALLTAGANVNVQDSGHKTPLHLAVEKDYHESVSALLTAGADVNARDTWKRTTLHWAVLNGPIETVSVLLTAGADVNVQDYEQRTPLHLVAQGGHHETVSALLAAGADVNVWDKWQRTPLYLAAMADFHETVSALVTAVADVNECDNSMQKTLLHLAAENDHHETVSALLTAGADVNVQDSEQRTPLHLAAEKGHHKTVSALLAAGADVNAWNKLKRTALHLAALYSHHKTVSALLTAGADVNVQDDEQRTPMHLAALYNHHKTVSALLAAGADVNVQDDEQRTPLHLAAEKGQPEAVSALLTAGADVNVQDSGQKTPLHLAAIKLSDRAAFLTARAGVKAHTQVNEEGTPLHLAVEKGHHETISALLAAGADVNVQDSEQRSVLHLAAEKDQYETVSALMTAGADVNVQDRQQRTPLHLAAEKGHHKTVSALLRAGTNVNVQDGQQRTPLHLAAEKGHYKTVSVLLTAGADVNVRDCQQKSPLHLAAQRGHHRTVSALQTAGTDVNVQDRQQRTPLHLAAEEDHYFNVRALLTAGADVNVQDCQQRTPLHLAAEKGHHRTILALLTAGADVNVQDSQQMTPLHLAAEKGHHLSRWDRLKGTHQHRAAWMGHYKMVSLLAAGADVNVRDSQQRTPLHLAAWYDHHEAMSVLLTAGADVNVQDSGGFTPLQYATKQGHSKCVEVLLQHKADKDGQEKVLDTILSWLEETDVRLLMRVWSARTGKKESTGAGVPADLIRDMIKSAYIATGDLRMLEKDIIAAGISFPAIVQDIPGVPEELKYTRTLEAAVGPTGGELEIPGFVKLIVPPDALQQDTMITISTVDVAAILRGPESVNWLSGYPWSLDEDACPRELLEQVLFSPAVDVNLHGAKLNGPVEVQTWRPPGSEGMKCILLKHHDAVGWTDVTASTRHRIDSDRMSMLLQNFSFFTPIWAFTDMVKAMANVIVKTLLAALSSRTCNCWFAAYLKPVANDVQFHVVCRDESVQTDEYLLDFINCGSNEAMFDIFHGDVLDIGVSVYGGQCKSVRMEVHSNKCRKQNGQNIQMLLRRNGECVKGEVDVRKVQGSSFRPVCQFIFLEEGDTLQSHYKRDSTTESTRSSPKRLRVEDLRQRLAATTISDDSKTKRGDLLPTETSRTPAGPCDFRTYSIVRASGSKPVVLLINDEYSNSHNDVSTIHCQMATFLASKGAVVYSTVLGATKDDEDDAAADGVQLIFPTKFEGDKRKPSLDWLTWEHLGHFPNLPSDIDFIVGHVNDTSRAARRIKEQRFPDAKLVQVTHEIPEETSQYKGDEEVMSIGEAMDSILDDLRHANVIFSVGPLIHDNYTHQTKQLQLEHHEFLPKPSDIFTKMQVNYINTETKVVLSVGRIKGMERLKGYDLVAKAMFMVMEELSNAKWRAFGVSPEDFPESKAIIQANVEKGKIHFTPLKHTTQKELSEEMKRAHVVLMPSRAEPFGLVGLEAIAAGVPVLVSHKSGLAWFLDKHPDLDRPIVEIEDDDGKAAKTLAKRITKVLKDGSKEFEAARKMKEHLLASKPWEESHDKFLETFGL